MFLHQGGGRFLSPNESGALLRFSWCQKDGGKNTWIIAQKMNDNCVGF